MRKRQGRRKGIAKSLIHNAAVLSIKDKHNPVPSKTYPRGSAAYGAETCTRGAKHPCRKATEGSLRCFLVGILDKSEEVTAFVMGVSTKGNTSLRPKAKHIFI